MKIRRCGSPARRPGVVRASGTDSPKVVDVRAEPTEIAVDYAYLSNKSAYFGGSRRRIFSVDQLYLAMAGTDRGTNTQRTTLVLDLDELERAQIVLGTRTIRDTVNRALREVNRQAALRRAAALVRQGGLDIVEPEELTELRRDRA